MRVKVLWIMLVICAIGTAYHMACGYATRSVLGFAGCVGLWHLIQTERKVDRMTK